MEILEQPVEKFRFRYKSEMAGTHGSLTGVNSDRSRKQTFPTVVVSVLYEARLSTALLRILVAQLQWESYHSLFAISAQY